MLEKILQFNFKRLAIVASVLAAINLLCFNHVIELRGEEPRRAIVSYEMMETGELIVPHIHGETYYNKPPLYNWIMASSLAVFGTNDWAVRLPGALSLLATSLVIFLMMKNYFSREIAIMTSLSFLASIDILFYGSVNTGEIDLFYSLITVLQLWSIFHFFEKKQFLKLFVISYVLMTIGLLTKGIPSLAFQGLTLLGYFIFKREFWKLFYWQHFVGLGIASLLTYLFLISYSESADLGAFLSQQFKETTQRTANDEGIGRVIVQLFIFPVFMMKNLAPWAIFAFAFLSKKIRKAVWNNKLAKYALVMVAVNVLIYWTAPDLRERYVYMFFPFLLIILFAVLTEKDWEETIWMKIAHAVFGLAMVVAPIGILILPFILDIATPYILVSSFILTALLILLALQFFRQRTSKHAGIILIVALLICRLAYSVTILPKMADLDDRLDYRAQVQGMCDYAGDRDIVLAGRPQIMEPEITLAGHTFYEHSMGIPPELPFQIPYYYASYADKIMTYEEVPSDPSKLYLVYEYDLEFMPHVRPRYAIKAHNTGFTIHLVELIFEAPSQ